MILTQCSPTVSIYKWKYSHPWYNAHVTHLAAVFVELILSGKSERCWFYTHSRKNQAWDAKCSEFSMLRIPIKLRKALTPKINVGCFLLKWGIFAGGGSPPWGELLFLKPARTFIAISMSAEGCCSRKNYCRCKTIGLEHLGKGEVIHHSRKMGQEENMLHSKHTIQYFL